MELFGLTRSELVALCDELKAPAFRAKQIADWLYAKGVNDISQMTNLPGALRQQLASQATLTRAEIVKESRSEDRTTKYLLRLADGETIETVLLPYAERVSVCVSTQVGCAMGCTFCATGECGFVRNLTAGEIVDQVLTLQQRGGARVTHVVFMGMGEPLANLPNLLKAIELLHTEIGISMRRLTVSTVGITPAIGKLAELDLQLTLAVSLHAPDDELRRQLIPFASQFPLADLISACKDYADRTKRRITFEYLLIAGVNDSPAHALSLAKLLKGILCHVNLIPYNRVIGKPYERPKNSAIAAFRMIVEHEGIEVTQRMERGHAVAAACGQLRKSAQ